jgi:hypothetical protein
MAIPDNPPPSVPRFVNVVFDRREPLDIVRDRLEERGLHVAEAAWEAISPRMRPQPGKPVLFL